MSKSTGSARVWERVLPIKGNLSLDSSTKFCLAMEQSRTLFCMSIGALFMILSMEINFTKKAHMK